jgi:hypothetical protein
LAAKIGSFALIFILPVRLLGCLNVIQGWALQYYSMEGGFLFVFKQKLLKSKTLISGDLKGTHLA